MGQVNIGVGIVVDPRVVVRIGIGHNGAVAARGNQMTIGIGVG